MTNVTREPPVFAGRGFFCAFASFALIEHLCYAAAMGVQRFVKVDPVENQRRWYVVAWGPTLFGNWAVVRSWGRLGTNWSQCRVEEFATVDEAIAEAEAQMERRMKREYAGSG